MSLLLLIFCITLITIFCFSKFLEDKKFSKSLCFLILINICLISWVNYSCLFTEFKYKRTVVEVKTFKLNDGYEKQYIIVDKKLIPLAAVLPGVIFPKNSKLLYTEPVTFFAGGIYWDIKLESKSPKIKLIKEKIY